jgi:truncated hemoglobin YjbI
MYVPISLLKIIMNTTKTIYTRLGGEQVLRDFVENLYFFMDHFPAVERIRSMHPRDLTDTSQHLFMFLSGMLGGPPLFCAENAANQLKIDGSVRQDLMTEITRMANHLRNKDGMLSSTNGWKSASLH